jgi:hypothetical protein
MTIEHRTLPPVDAPFVPGGGPRYRGPLASFRSRETAWIRWWCTVAVLVVAATLTLPVCLALDVEEGPFMATLGVFAGLAIVACVPASRLGWRQRPDRYDDEMCRYAHGVTASYEPDGERGVFRRGGAVVATVTRAPRGVRRVARVGDRHLGLDEAVLTTVPQGEVREVALRLVDVADGTVHATASGHRAGDLVDWTLELPLGELRLRQRLHAVPSRRTALDRWGRAWRLRGNVVRGRWTAVLPTAAGPVDVVAVTWIAAHLDAVGMDRCHGDRSGGPARRAQPGFDAAAPEWVAVGSVPGARPSMPTGDVIDL